MPSASELKPKDVILHPYTGQGVTVDRVRPVKSGVRIYFKSYGITGSIILKPDAHIELAPERRQR
jgi:hypothetical protein